ncbi:nectin-1-like isoform X2 [Lethenteron reissneri]|uniref:nectin-1-like isoform X2 n=1 Tax=Lethenteron reissneri TaxID=7753 RepID=UPI002AB69671|nr:nectin-1-like isoform X2 [Lethenteron reissneri]
MDTLCFAQRVMIAVLLLLLLPATLGAQSITSEIDHDSEASSGSGGDVQLRCVYKGSVIVNQIIWAKETNQERVYIAVRLNDISIVQDDKLKGRLTFLGHGNNDATISIRALRTLDSGTYICRFTTTTQGTKEAKINLIVVVTPEVRLALGPAPLVSGGSKSQLAATCVAANGNPAARVAWTLKNVSGSHFVFEALKDDAGTIIDHKNGSISVMRELRLEPTKEMNKASLVCIVTQPGNGNRIEKIVALNVHYKPEVTISGVTGPMQEGSAKVTLTCLADANPSAKYSWMRNGTHMNGSDHSTLTLDRAVSNSGMYRCIAVNYVGSDAGEIEVNITYAQDGIEPCVIAVATVVALMALVAVFGAIYFFRKKGSPVTNRMQPLDERIMNSAETSPPNQEASHYEPLKPPEENAYDKLNHPKYTNA